MFHVPGTAAIVRNASFMAKVRLAASRCRAEANVRHEHCISLRIKTEERLRCTRIALGRNLRQAGRAGDPAGRRAPPAVPVLPAFSLFVGTAAR
jgi:hypothetical protein